MIASVISNILPPLMVIGYVWCRKLHKDTWGGWSFESLEEWGQYMKLAVPGMLMLVVEWSSFEIVNFIAGALGETELSANIVWFQLLVILFMVRYAACTKLMYQNQKTILCFSLVLVSALPPRFEWVMN